MGDRNPTRFADVLVVVVAPSYPYQVPTVRLNQRDYLPSAYVHSGLFLCEMVHTKRRGRKNSIHTIHTNHVYC